MDEKTIAELKKQVALLDERLKQVELIILGTEILEDILGYPIE